MRFVVYGAGAVGGTIGARLFQAGHSVLLIARGPHREAIEKSGLSFESPHESVQLPIPVVGAPAAIEFTPDDVVLLTMKSQHADAALGELADAAGEDVPVICAQNGVANERLAARRFTSVYGMVVMLPANHVEPGVVQAQSGATTGLLDAGIYPRGVDDRIAQVTSALDAAGFAAQPDPAIMRLKYAKLLRNLGNALVACCAPSERASELLARAREEAEACFAAAGIDCASGAEFAARRGDRIRPEPIRGRMRGGGSTWQSLARSQGSVEVDYLNGEIVLLGRLHGVPTPVNRALQLATHRLCREAGPPQSLPIETLIESIGMAVA